MIAVIFEVLPREGRKQDYLDLAAQLRPALEKLDGFISIERFQSLAIEAETRLARLAIGNAAVAFGDGLAILPGIGPFDRIIVQGLLTEIPENLLAALAVGGLLVAARPDPKSATRQQIARITRDEAGSLEETPVCASRLQALLPGEARAL